MPSITTEVTHDLGQEAALARLRDFVHQMRERHANDLTDMEGEWNENRLHYGFKTRGLHIKGTLTVEDGLARVDCQIPFAALIFRGRLESEIRTQLTQALRG